MEREAGPLPAGRPEAKAPAEDRAPLRLTALLAVVAVATMLIVGVGWPSHANPSFEAPIVVRVSEVAWTLTGCATGIPPQPGATIFGGTDFAADVNVTVPTNATGCVIASVHLTSPGFSLVTALLPNLVPGRTASWATAIGAPDAYLTIALSIVVDGHVVPARR